MKNLFTFLTCLLLLGGVFTPEAQAGRPAPLNDRAFYQIDDALDALALGEAMGLCKNDMDACFVAMSKEMHRAFKVAGYSLEQSVARITKSERAVMMVQTSKWRDVYIYVLSAAESKKAAKVLLKEKILSSATIKQVQKVMKALR